MNPRTPALSCQMAIRRTVRLHRDRIADSDDLESRPSDLRSAAAHLQAWLLGDRCEGPDPYINLVIFEERADFIPFSDALRTSSPRSPLLKSTSNA